MRMATFGSQGRGHFSRQEATAVDVSTCKSLQSPTLLASLERSAKHHVHSYSLVLQVGVSPSGTFFAESQSGVTQNLGFRPLFRIRSILLLWYCRPECPRPELFLQSRSLENRDAHTRRRRQGRVDRVGCGYGCQLAVGSGRLSLPKYVFYFAGVADFKHCNAPGFPMCFEFPDMF